LIGNLLGGSAALLLALWLSWVFVTPVDCERVRRGAAPMRALFDTLSWGVRHWASPEDRMDFIATGMEWDLKSQRFLAKQFYGDALDCVQASGQESGQGRAHGA
jgi:hypothetical protein